MSKKKIVLISVLAVLLYLTYIGIIYLTYEEPIAFKDMSAKEFATAFDKGIDKEYRIQELSKTAFKGDIDFYNYHFHESVEIWITENPINEKMDFMIIKYYLTGGKEAGRIFGSVVMQAILLSTDWDKDVRSDILDELEIMDIESWKSGNLIICEDVNDLVYMFDINDDFCSLTIIKRQ